MIKINENNSISPAEWEIMRIIWTLKQSYTSEIIKQVQAKKAWSESTIKTLMRRLVAKGYLNAQKSGNRFIYSPAINQAEMMFEQTNKLLQQMCDMDKGELLLSILKTIPISQHDIKMLQAELNKKMKSAPVSVPCNCLKIGQHNC